MKRQIIIGIISVFVSGLIFHVLIPAVLQFVISAFLSAATLLDPLYAKGRVETFWTAFVVILVLQFVFTVFISLIIGVSVALLAQKIESGWVYAASAFLSIIVHFILLFIFGGFSLIFADKDSVISFLILFAILITITAPIIGLISMAFVRKFSPKKE